MKLLFVSFVPFVQFVFEHFGSGLSGLGQIHFTILEDMMQTKSSFVRTMAVALICVLGIMIAALQAQSAEAEFPIISTDQLKAMVDAKKDFMLIDARTKDEYQEAHILGAVSIPENRIEESLTLLPTDKSHRLVFYCNGVKCGKSKKAARKAAAAGYNNMLIYGEGFPVWEEKGLLIVPGPGYAKKIETIKIGPRELKKLLDGNNKDYVIVDVRAESEYKKEGHIPGAVNIPLETFASRSEVLPKEKMVIVYCNAGGRSYSAYRKLMKLAYPSIAQALFADWKEAGMPIEK